jgi:uncharacterized protein YcbX
MFFKSGNNSLQRRLKVQVWNDSFEAALEPDLYSQALSQHLGVNCRLVRYAPYSERRVRSHHKDWKPEVRFADGRPLLLANKNSLQDLNQRLASPVPADRFRANIWIDNAPAYAEDSWQRIRIGEVTFSLPKKCSRCTIINIDQATGELRGPDPLKTLATYRRVEKDIFFGSLWIPENTGVIKAGDTLEVLE